MIAASLVTERSDLGFPGRLGHHMCRYNKPTHLWARPEGPSMFSPSCLPIQIALIGKCCGWFVGGLAGQLHHFPRGYLPLLRLRLLIWRAGPYIQQKVLSHAQGVTGQTMPKVYYITRLSKFAACSQQGTSPSLCIQLPRRTATPPPPPHHLWVCSRIRCALWHHAASL